jgi:hypothetical protein
MKNLTEDALKIQLRNDIKSIFKENLIVSG